jgi:purine-binding chemotaxis protein CheW
MTELFLLAVIDGRGIAIEAGQVDSVIDIGEIVAVPRVDAAIRGLAALRSRVVTVVDTRRLLDLAPALDGGRRAVTTSVDGQLYAFLVDALEDVAPFERQPIASGIALNGAWHDAGTGTIERDGEPLLIVDLAALVRTAPALAA